MRFKCIIFFFFTFLLLFTSYLPAQIGMGTTNPHISSILEISSTTKGILTPRMTSLQRTTIATPADGLLVYDTDEGAFYYFENAIWNKMQSQGRDNYKLVKNASDLADELAAGGGSTYLLTSNTYYEINGSITLAAPIDINNAYVSGIDANEDKLVGSGGPIFSGTNGGSIRNLTLISLGGSVFNLTGSGAESLVFQNSIIVNSGSVGNISNFQLVFMSIVQLVNNTDGFTFTDINSLLLSNLGWFGNNTGTFETYVGSFDLIEKVSGFSDISAGVIGIDVSANPTVGAGVISGTPFSGVGTHVLGYTAGTYPGYFFSNNWNVDCPGLKVENDISASANFYFNGSLTTGFVQSITNGTAVPIQGSGTFTATNLFRFTEVGGNRLVYDGIENRSFQVNASLSVRITSASGNFYAIILYKNGVEVTESNAIVYVDSDTQIQNIAITSDIDLSNGDYIEVYVKRLTGTGTDSLIVFSENISVK
ncbi:cell wall anchor protein [uncultured Algibacter sp.]|uniref:cell wall anchor protein n=1 Tax=uncultured Algibacter sp. TaxID=298659 RepID=UPI00262E4764|nr:cell wall anchor protein [uncultured Algibacter sp.]